MFQESYVDENLFNFSPVMSAVMELVGDPPVESFEIEYFAEDLEQAIFNLKSKIFRKASEEACRAPMGDVSYFVYMDEGSYAWKHLQ